MVQALTACPDHTDPERPDSVSVAGKNGVSTRAGICDSMNIDNSAAAKRRWCRISQFTSRTCHPERGIHTAIAARTADRGIQHGEARYALYLLKKLQQIVERYALEANLHLTSAVGL